jgi:hypothetical protein
MMQHTTSVIASRPCGEAIQSNRTGAGAGALDCFIAALLAMTVFPEVPS